MIINTFDVLQVEVDIESHAPKVSGFLFATVSANEVSDAGIDPLFFVRSLLPALLPVLTHFFYYIFVNSKLSDMLKTFVVLPISNIGSLAKFSDYIPISLLVCVCVGSSSNCGNDLLTVFQFGFCWHYSTVAAVLKVTEDNRLKMKDY
jgi:hypothetical protein